MSNTRQSWIRYMISIIDPVLTALADGRLKKDMPVEHHKDALDRESCTYLEALGRTACGIAPWLETPAEDEEEEKLRVKYAELTRRAINMAVRPDSPDNMNFSVGGQPIVDAAFLAHAILRAPTELYNKLDDDTKRFLVEKMKETRTRKPCFNNWLLFSAMIEAFLKLAKESDFDPMRVDYALRQHEQWFLGGGLYGDGPSFHADYYNSYVIQPMLTDILRFLKGCEGEWDAMTDQADKNLAVYASILERLVAPDGSYPIVGRSSCYRFGAFHALAHAALEKKLEKSLSPAQVRCALNAVIERVMSYPDMFDDNGWLKIGVCGSQPELGEFYISTGSLYLCTTVFLPLGLPESDPFWSGEDTPWTQKKLWRN